MSLTLAVRILFDAVEALVDVLLRRVPVGESVRLLLALGLRMPSGCGKGTGVGVEFGEAMIVLEALQSDRTSFCVNYAAFPMYASPWL